MPREHITTVQKEVLQQLWDEGMTSTTKKELIQKAVEKTGLCENRIMNWIGNTKQKLGMAVKRGPREENKSRMAGNVRKRSAYTVFKKEFLTSETAKKLREEGVPDSQVQAKENLEYHQLSPNSKERYTQAAAEINSSLPESSGVSKESRIRRLVKNIQANMKQLDQLGCASIWLGFNGKVPERFYSPELSDLGEDAAFTNYVMSAVVHKLARSQMQSSSGMQPTQPSKTKQRSKSNERRKAGNIKVPEPEANTSKNHEDEKMRQLPDSCDILRAGDIVSLEDENSKKIGDGEVTNQTAVHGRELKEGWIPLMVLHIADGIRPHNDYPTHSG